MLASLPLLFLFSSTLFLGTLMALSSNNWLMLWIGLELNLMSFIPLVMMSPSQQEVEGVIKYFLPQALGSGILLISGFAMNSDQTFISSFAPMMLIISLIIKAGMAPSHFWFPTVMASLSWPLCILLSTWQKLSPMLIIFFLNNSNTISLLSITAGMSSLIGGIGGLNQTGLRPILAYSSINHMGWMVASSVYSTLISMMYLFLYIIMVIVIMSMFFLINMFSINQMMTTSKSSLAMSLILSLMVMSLAGLPPLIGFFPKWMSIQIMISNSAMILTILLILGSLISLYFYMSIIFNLILNSSSQFNLKKNSMFSPLSVIIMTISISPIFIL